MKGLGDSKESDCTISCPATDKMESLATSVASLASQVTSQDSPSTRPDTPATSVGSSRKTSRAYRLATQVVTVENPDPQHQDQWGSSSVPIYQTATFKGMGGQYDYTRSGNPTRSFLEHHIAKISGSQHAFAVSSGMGALDVIFRLLKPGDHVIAGELKAYEPFPSHANRSK